MSETRTVAVIVLDIRMYVEIYIMMTTTNNKIFLMSRKGVGAIVGVGPRMKQIKKNNYNERAKMKTS